MNAETKKMIVSKCLTALITFVTSVLGIVATGIGSGM